MFVMVIFEVEKNARSHKSYGSCCSRVPTPLLPRHRSTVLVSVVAAQIPRSF
jgi:hypothetical protein